MPRNGINKGRKRLFKLELETILLRITIPKIREKQIRKAVDAICKNDLRE